MIEEEFASNSVYALAVWTAHTTTMSRGDTKSANNVCLALPIGVFTYHNLRYNDLVVSKLTRDTIKQYQLCC